MTYIATELRAIAANPTPDAIGDIYRLACMVERYERQMDRVFQAAREDDQRARTVAELARLTEPQS